MLPGFLVANHNVSPSHRKCISLPSTKVMNQGAMPDSPTGPAPVPGKPALPGFRQGNAPIPVSIPLRVIEHFPMVFTPGCHISMLRMWQGFDAQRFATYNCTQRNQGGVW